MLSFRGVPVALVFALVSHPSWADPPGKEPVIDDRPLSAWVEALKSEDLRECDLAQRVLQQLGAEAKPALPALVKLLKDSDLGVRLRVYVILASIGPDAREAIGPLIDTFRHRDVPLPVITQTFVQIGP